MAKEVATHKFGSTSLDRLENIDDRLKALAYKVLELQDTTIIYGRRTMEEQKQLFRQGLSRTLDSKHLSGKAIDMAPYPIDWNNTKRFYYFAGLVIATAKQLDINIRWGGNWDMDEDLDDQSFMDLVHFELID